MIVAQISDSHISLPEPDNSHRLDDLKTAVDEINELKNPADVVVHTGDVSHNATEEEYHAAKQILDNLKAPLFVIPGNRDRRQIMRKMFGGKIGPEIPKPFIQYSLDQWNTKLILLDTLNENDRVGEICRKRMEHLAEMLNKDSEKPTVIFMHHPPYDVVEAPHPFQFDSRETVEKLNNLTATHRQIIGIFCGHSHRATTGKLGNIPASTIPALSIDLRFGKFAESQKHRPIIYVHEF